jgi:hypothetical protein
MAEKSVSALFQELIALGHILPVGSRFDLAMPTAYRSVPSRITNGTPDIPVRMGVSADADMGFDTSRNSARSSDQE